MLPSCDDEILSEITASTLLCSSSTVSAFAESSGSTSLTKKVGVGGWFFFLPPKLKLRESLSCFWCGVFSPCFFFGPAKLLLRDTRVEERFSSGVSALNFTAFGGCTTESVGSGKTTFWKPAIMTLGVVLTRFWKVNVFLISRGNHTHVETQAANSWEKIIKYRSYSRNRTHVTGLHLFTRKENYNSVS